MSTQDAFKNKPITLSVNRGVDDKPSRFDALYLWEKAKPKCWKIKVEVEEVK